MSDGTLATYFCAVRSPFMASLRTQVTNMASLPPHPNVLKLLGACMDPQHLALVTEFCSRYVFSFAIQASVLAISRALQCCADLQALMSAARSVLGAGRVFRYNTPICQSEFWVRFAAFQTSQLVPRTTVIPVPPPTHVGALCTTSYTHPRGPAFRGGSCWPSGWAWRGACSTCTHAGCCTEVGGTGAGHYAHYVLRCERSRATQYPSIGPAGEHCMSFVSCTCSPLPHPITSSALPCLPVTHTFHTCARLPILNHRKPLNRQPQSPRYWAVLNFEATTTRSQLSISCLPACAVPYRLEECEFADRRHGWHQDL